MKKIKILAITCALIMTTNVHAALQSRPGVYVKNYLTPSEFFKQIREMETSNGALGLNSMFEEDATTKEYKETTQTNNIDSHMIKNTEWGAAVMLSASDYGAGVGNVVNSYSHSTMLYGDTSSTTGNKSGIYGLNIGPTQHEFVAGGIIEKMTENLFGYLISAPNRYVDKYASSDDSTDSTRFIFGDATYETNSFKAYKGDSYVYNNYPLFTRGSADIFEFSVTKGEAQAYNSTRACVWVGDGI